ncbi:MAG: hypothetical protein RBR50_01140 [Candidatus Izemoplasmatales bacterium]|nr:hypothetical protein [Candidatus Izemoplasmatales bacterium]
MKKIIIALMLTATIQANNSMCLYSADRMIKNVDKIKMLSDRRAEYEMKIYIDIAIGNAEDTIIYCNNGTLKNEARKVLSNLLELKKIVE